MFSLHVLYISDNKLKDFSIKNCPTLKELYIGRNLLTKLEINDFPVLTKLSIEENQNLTQLIFKNLPYLDLINMKALNFRSFTRL